MNMGIIVFICGVVNIGLAFYLFRMFADLRKRRQKLEELVDKYKFGLIDAYADGGKIITKIMRQRINAALEKWPPRDCFAEWLITLVDQLELGCDELRKENKEAIKNGELCATHKERTSDSTD